MLFGQFLLKTQAVSNAQVRRASKLKADLSPSLAEIALYEGVLTVEQLQELRRMQRRQGTLFDEQLIDSALCDRDRISTLKAQVMQASMPIGQALVLCGAMTDAQLAERLDAFKAYNDSLAAPRGESDSEAPSAAGRPEASDRGPPSEAPPEKRVGSPPSEAPPEKRVGEPPEAPGGPDEGPQSSTGAGA